jgi:anaerobic selenocysteine-containing dehydrogenase
VTLNEPAIAPLGEAKPNTEIFRLLADRLGFDRPELRASDEELLVAAAACAPPGVELEALRERGWAKVLLDGDPFPTASRKVELVSERLRARGIDPLPFYDPPVEVADVELAARYPLALVTPKTHLFLNSTFPNQRRQAAAQPEPYVVLHPADAEPRGIADGARVRVRNDRGAFTVRASVSDDARPGVAVCPMGWWNASWPAGLSCQATTSQRLTPVGAGPVFNDNRVEVELADGSS